MSLSSYNPHDRYKRRAASRMISLAMVVIGIGSLVMIGFWIGKQFSTQESISLAKRYDDLVAQSETLQTELTEARVDAQTAALRYRQLQETYEDMIAEGPMQELVTLLKTQLEQGMDPQRLSFVIRSARPPSNCSDPITKRFVVSTPAYQGADSTISIAEGQLRIKATGASSRSKDGKPEAWYDPAKRVKISFAPANGKADNKQGVMPLQHSMVVGNREYRFNVSEGARSFAKITYDSCDYP